MTFPVKSLDNANEGRYTLGMKTKLLISGLLTIAISLGSLASAGASERKVDTRLLGAINKYLVVDYKIGIKKQNSSNDAICRQGIDLENAALRNFDNILSSLKLPKKDHAQVQAVLTDDAILQSLHSTLAVNVNNNTNYNSLAPSVSSAQATLGAAVQSLVHKLGLKS